MKGQGRCARPFASDSPGSLEGATGAFDSCGTCERARATPLPVLTKKELLVDRLSLSFMQQLYAHGLVPGDNWLLAEGG